MLFGKNLSFPINLQLSSRRCSIVDSAQKYNEVRALPDRRHCSPRWINTLLLNFGTSLLDESLPLTALIPNLASVSFIRSQQNYNMSGAPTFPSPCVFRFHWRSTFAWMPKQQPCDTVSGLNIPLRCIFSVWGNGNNNHSVWTEQTQTLSGT